MCAESCYPIWHKEPVCYCTLWKILSIFCDLRPKLFFNIRIQLVLLQHKHRASPWSTIIIYSCKETEIHWKSSDIMVVSTRAYKLNLVKISSFRLKLYHFYLCLKQSWPTKWISGKILGGSNHSNQMLQFFTLYVWILSSFRNHIIYCCI